MNPHSWQSIRQGVLRNESAIWLRCISRIVDRRPGNLFNSFSECVKGIFAVVQGNRVDKDDVGGAIGNFVSDTGNDAYRPNVFRSQLRVEVSREEWLCMGQRSRSA